MDNQTTLVGNAVTSPSLRSTKDGTFVTSFRIATTQRKLDKASGQWKDGDTLYLGVSCWRALAQNVVKSVRKGDPILVSGRLVPKAWVSKEGESRTSIEVEATLVCHDLNRGQSVFVRTAKGALTQTVAEATAGAVTAAGLASQEDGGPVDSAVGEVVEAPEGGAVGGEAATAA